jgi:hypothetical protein
MDSSKSTKLAVCVACDTEFWSIVVGVAFALWDHNVVEWIKAVTNKSDKITTSKFGIWWIKFIQVGVTIVVESNILDGILLSIQGDRKWLSNIYDI